MPAIEQSKILILATDGYERSELRVPLDELKAKGATVHIASPKTDPIKSWDEDNWGDTVNVAARMSDKSKPGHVAASSRQRTKKGPPSH